MSARLEPMFVTVKEAAEFLGLQPWRIYELLDGKDIVGKYDKSKRLVLVSSLREWGENLSDERPQKESA